jgi:hypothetical protein
MTEREENTTETGSTTILERAAQSILIGYAWVSGPAMSERQRMEKELAKAHVLELELESTSIVG